MKTVTKKVIVLTFIAAGLTLSFSRKSDLDALNKGQIKLAKKAMDALFKNYNAKEVKKYLKKDYIQHNPNVPTGRTAIIGFLPALKKSGTTYETHRIFTDENFVILHNTYKNAQPFGAEEMVAFDIWRIEDGKIAEHWDAVTPKVEKTANGRTQVDGETLLTDLDKTDANKALVKELIEQVFIAGRSNTITNYISTTQYDQHNPMVKDGLSGLSEAITYLSSQNNMFKYYKIHRLLGQGNFVLAVVEGEWNQKPHVFYDLFRVKDGKVVEHWDVVNEIPQKMAHQNGLFNF
ncbi:nuclear transport factor 2 family protein [Spongiimicrobium salis]|uniref:nuclear transport factor 2 family protein n=1 Tax=Spongiimicrobium salis TaxID=1667022 RepID=UPI00374CDB41